MLPLPAGRAHELWLSHRLLAELTLYAPQHYPSSNDIPVIPLLQGLSMCLLFVLMLALVFTQKQDRSSLSSDFWYIIKHQPNKIVLSQGSHQVLGPCSEGRSGSEDDGVLVSNRMEGGFRG